MPSFRFRNALRILSALCVWLFGAVGACRIQAQTGLKRESETDITAPGETPSAIDLRVCVFAESEDSDYYAKLGWGKTNDKLAPPFTSVARAESLNDSRNCDLMIQFGYEARGFGGSWYTAQIYSAYSKTNLGKFQAAKHGFFDPHHDQTFARLSAQIIAAFRKGGASYNKLAAERKEFRKQTGEAQLACDDRAELVARLEREEPAFQLALKDVRTGQSPAQLPEEGRRYAVQAKYFVEQKQLAEAASRYADALTIAPGWASGRYNRALILAEMTCYEAAILEMRHYLLLSPDGPDARTAQDKVYVWEAASGVHSPPSPRPAPPPAAGSGGPASATPEKPPA